MPMINIKKQSLVTRLFVVNLISIGILALAALVFLFLQKFVNEEILVFIIEAIPEMFSDFSQVVKFALSDNPYISTIGTSYPPLAIVIMYPFAIICKGIEHLSFFEMYCSVQFWISYLLFLSICFTFSFLLIKRALNVKGRGLIIFFLTFFISGMAWYMIIRGNNIIIVLCFTMFYLAFYKSQNKILKELALISLAFSGAIKIYPLFFGILLLKDKRILASIRVAIYTFALFIVPFLFFDGGISNIKLFMDNLSEFSYGGNRLLINRNLSVSGLIYKFFYRIQTGFSVDTQSASEVFSAIAILVTASTSIIISFITKNKLSLYVICVATIILIPPVSYYYALIFLLIPLIEFVNDYENIENKRKCFYLAFFIIVPCIIFCPFTNFIMHSLFICVALIYETIYNLHRFSKEREKTTKGEIL